MSRLLSRLRQDRKVPQPQQPTKNLSQTLYVGPKMRNRNASILYARGQSASKLENLGEPCQVAIVVSGFGDDGRPHTNSTNLNQLTCFCHCSSHCTRRSPATPMDPATNADSTMSLPRDFVNRGVEGTAAWERTEKSRLGLRGKSDWLRLVNVPPPTCKPLPRRTPILATTAKTEDIVIIYFSGGNQLH